MASYACAACDATCCRNCVRLNSAARQVGGGDVAPQAALAGKRNRESDSLIAAIARRGIEDVRLSRDVRGERRIGERGGGDDVRARLFHLRARRRQRGIAHERLVDRLLARKPQRLECLRRGGDGKENRAAARMQVQELREIIDNLRHDRRSDARNKYETELWIREGDARVRVPVEMIERLEADGDYVRLHVGQRVRLMRARLGDLADRLDPSRFVRVHRSEIVRHDLIAAIRRHESGRTFAVSLAAGKFPSVAVTFTRSRAHITLS